MVAAKDKLITDNLAKWLDHIQKAEAQGLSLKNYAAKHNINPQRLYQNKSELIKRGVLHKNKREGKTLNGFSKVILKDKPCDKSDMNYLATITLPNGIEIRTSNLNTALIQSLMEISA